MRYFGGLKFVLVGATLGVALGAAPAAPSYQLVESAIARVRSDWAKPGVAADPNAPGWNALFDALLRDLRTYATATTDADRLTALGRVHQESLALRSVSWRPAAQVHEALRTWLEPRVRVAWAERRLLNWVKGLPQAADSSVKGNRERWLQFVGEGLGQALQKYDAAATVADRQEALRSVHAALDALQSRNQAVPWAPSIDLQSALNGMYNQPNMDVSVDVGTLSPAINVNLVTSGPITRKGYVSQVTAGPKTGFGLMPSDDGIAFYNRQQLTSVTPITDFQRQVMSNQQGKRAAKLYYFGATTSDTSELTIVTVIRSTGLQILPSYRHNVAADINTTPQDSGKLGRAVASLVGFNQTKITRMAWENAIGQIRSNVETEAMEEGLERTQHEAAVRNATLAQYLIGGNRVAFRNILIEGLTLRSRPENALIGGKFGYVNAKEQFGADAPQPPSLNRPDPGVSADLHLSSVMANFLRGYIESDAVKEVHNLMIETRDVAPGTPPKDGVKVTRNVDYPTYFRAVESAQAANNPKVAAIRVKRPTAPPDFGADSQGNLVALVKDFQLDVPAPPQMAKGGVAGPPARVLRIVSPRAEFAISFRVSRKSEQEPLRLTGRIESFDAGPAGRVYAINEDENQATQLNAFAGRFVLVGFGTKLQGQPIDLPLSDVQMRGFAIQSVSPLDPSGWIRVNLVRTSASPGAGIQAPPGAAPLTPGPSPSAGPGAGVKPPQPSPNPAPPVSPAPNPKPPTPPPVPAPRSTSAPRPGVAR